MTHHRAPSMLQALRRVLSPTKVPYGSGGRLFGNAYFGRDAVEVAEDLLTSRPDIARAVILTLARLQGTRLDGRMEEEPGKIHHEYRSLVMDGTRISGSSEQIFRDLARRWLPELQQEGPLISELITYWTVDATPLYVRLVSKFHDLYGPPILSEKYTPRRPGDSPLTIAQSVHDAVSWVARQVERSSLELLEFQRRTPFSHPYQAWKDGITSYIHPDAAPANYHGPIASIEVQGLAYDALTSGAEMPGCASEIERVQWLALADALQKQTLSYFWMPDDQYFAMAIDRDAATQSPQQVKLLTSNGAAVLDSSLFDTLSPEMRAMYVASIVGRAYGEEFLTNAGIRCTSLKQKDVLDYPAYQSSYTVWHKETYDIAKGMRRQGFPRLAEDLENRLLNAINVSGRATEFLYVLPDGRVDYEATDRPSSPAAEEIAATNVPDDDQAWTISAAIAVKCERGSGRTCLSRAGTWQSRLEDDLLAQTPAVKLLRTIPEIEAVQAHAGAFWINRERGQKRESAYLQEHALTGNA